MTVFFHMLFPTESANIGETQVVMSCTNVGSVTISFHFVVMAKRVDHGGKGYVVDQVTAKKHSVFTVNFLEAPTAPVEAKPMEPGCHLGENQPAPR